MRGSNQRVNARAAGLRRRQSPATRPPGSRRRSPLGPGSGAPRAARAFPAAAALARGPRADPTPAPPNRLAAVRGRTAGPGPWWEAGSPVSLGQGRCGPPPPACWAFRPPPRGAAHPPSSPATVADRHRAQPPCWLLFPFPESVASGPSANQGSQPRTYPANGIPAEGTEAPTRLRGRRASWLVVVHPRGRARRQSPRRPPHLPQAGNLRALRRRLEARSGKEAWGSWGCARGAVAAGERREESGRCSGLVASLCVGLQSAGLSRGVCTMGRLCLGVAART